MNTTFNKSTNTTFTLGMSINTDNQNNEENSKSKTKSNNSSANTTGSVATIKQQDNSRAVNQYDNITPRY